ncbi:MAG: ATP-binding protein [Sphingobium sp.]
MASRARTSRWLERLTGAVAGRPHLLLRLCAAVILAISLGALVLMLRIPIASIDAEMGARGTTELVGGGQPIILPADAMVTFRSQRDGTSVILPANLLPGVAEPRGSAAENARYWAGRDRLAHMLAAGPVEIVGQGKPLVMTIRSRTVSDLTIGFWLSMVAGAVAALAGLWVWVLRPRDWAPIMFALSGAALFVGCVTTALNVSPGLGMSGRLDQMLMIVNYADGAVCAGALMALFARFPQPLVPTGWLWLLGAVNLVPGVVVGFDALPNAVDIAILIVLGDSVGIIVLLLVQAWRARDDPQHRAGLMPIALCTGISTALFCVLSMVGQMNGGKPLVMPDMTAPLLLAIYLGMGVAITRARLFALGRWALSLLLSACAIILFLAFDAIILSTVTQARDLAFFLSCLLGMTVYLPMREWMLRKAERLREGQASDLLQYASDVALAINPEAAIAAWQDAIGAMFDPLERQWVDVAGAAPDICDKGRALYLPAPTGEVAMLLRHPAGGARIFAPSDLDTASRFAALVRRLANARDAYVRGVSEERGRIARDLHDDVSARLLTSLHRTDTQAIHDDVRGAMADIRTIVTGLSGGSQALQSLVAALRHETQMRLEAAGIDLIWPLSALDDDRWMLPYHRYRHLLSIVREGVSNIIRHSGATTATLQMAVTDGELRITLSDNGCGLAKDRPHGNGLLNSARRAKDAGGSFHIATVPTGTRMEIILPIGHANQASKDGGASPRLAGDRRR